jgi:peptidoglycan L-alanyl-D-glutamate endopeptidase CwlK
MKFQLSSRSLARLDGVHPKLVAVVKRAIEITDVDFGVTEGVRSLETQRQYYAAGKSQTMKSKHLRQEDGYSHAVDLVAYVGSNVSWELNLYDNICDAMRRAAREVGIGLTWGAAWHIDQIEEYDGSSEQAMLDYIDLRRSEGRRPFIDGPHYQISKL